jgi:hypothetical protein
MIRIARPLHCLVCGGDPVEDLADHVWSYISNEFVREAVSPTTGESLSGADDQVSNVLARLADYRPSTDGPWYVDRILEGQALEDDIDPTLDGVAVFHQAPS